MSTTRKNIIFVAAVLIGFWGIFVSYNHWTAEYAFNKGLTLTAQKRYGEAVPYYKKAIRLFPSEDFYRMHDGKNKLFLSSVTQLPVPTRMKIAKEAESIFQDLMVRDELNPWYSLRLSEVYGQMAKIDPKQGALYMIKSGEALKHSATVDANNPIFLFSYAQYLFSTKQYDVALPLLEEVYETDPSILGSATLLGKVYIYKQRYPEALDVFKHVYKQNPRVVPSIRNLSEAYYLAGDYDKALHIIQIYGTHDKAPTILRDYYQFLINAPKSGK